MVFVLNANSRLENKYQGLHKNNEISCSQGKFYIILLKNEPVILHTCIETMAITVISTHCMCQFSWIKVSTVFSNTQLK